MKIANGTETSESETQLINMIKEKELWVEDSLIIERLSSKPFALRISGKKSYTKPATTTYDFSCNLILASIGALLNWTSVEIAKRTDYPSLTTQGDWSGVRDSGDDKIYNIFQQFVIPMLSKPRTYTQQNLKEIVQSTTNVLNGKTENNFVVVNWEIQLAANAVLKIVFFNKKTKEEYYQIIPL